jgi:hypothetical protein
MPTFDHTQCRHQPWHEKLIATFEEVRDDQGIPNNMKDDTIVEMMQSFFYEDTNCDGCRLREIPFDERKPNYPFRVEALEGNGGDPGLVATYECRNCGHTYQVWYSTEFHALQFG